VLNGGVLLCRMDFPVHSPVPSPAEVPNLDRRNRIHPESGNEVPAKHTKGHENRGVQQPDDSPSRRRQACAEDLLFSLVPRVSHGFNPVFGSQNGRPGGCGTRLKCLKRLFRGCKVPPWNAMDEAWPPGRHFTGNCRRRLNRTVSEQ
jgi:hypothetical protein